MSLALRLLISDERPILREGLRRLLESEPGFQVVGQASHAADTIALARELAPDVLLLSVAVNGIPDALSELATFPCRVVLLTGAIERPQIVEALRLGVRGVLTKEATPELLFMSIRAVMANQYWVERESVPNLVQYVLQHRAAGNGNGHGASKPTFGLTQREMQIVSTVVAGYANKDIAQRFSLSEDTVKHHLSNIFDKVGASNRLELALFAIHHRLVDEAGPGSAPPLAPRSGDRRSGLAARGPQA
jgi:two-component system, NarL family, nitrate/nitrite response regulator NarL